MEEDKFALVEKIIKDVDHILSKNAELRSFDVVPVETNFQNKSPVLHLENCLGLESWCIKHVYMYCYSELSDKYFPKTKRRNVRLNSTDSERLARLLCVTLLLNPSINTFWNKRREMVSRNMLDKTSELQLTRLVLSRKPKCNEAFAYRRWILELTLQDVNLPLDYLQNLVNEELNICELTSEKSPNNYHSWNHRMWLLNILKKSPQSFNMDLLYIKEYNFSERWTSKHISDFSCFHYRQFCVKNILQIKSDFWQTFQNSIEINLRKSFVKILLQFAPNDCGRIVEENLLTLTENNLVNILFSYTSRSCNCLVDNIFVCKKLEVLFYELVLNNELIRFFKLHETLWYHRRFIIHEIIVTMYNYCGMSRQNGALVKNVCKKCNLEDLRQKQAKIVRYDRNRIYSSELFKTLISLEKNFIEERRNDSDNYSDRHEKYLKFVEGLKSVT